MADMVQNVLIIEGDINTLKKFEKQFSQNLTIRVFEPLRKRAIPVSRMYSFNAFIPIPDMTYLETDNDDWYNTNNDLWGTKWDLLYLRAFFNEWHHTLLYSFETAWNPPYPVITAMRDQYPGLTIHSLWEYTGESTEDAECLRVYSGSCPEDHEDDLVATETVKERFKHELAHLYRLGQEHLGDSEPIMERHSRSKKK